MKRPLVVAVLTAALLVHGCAPQRPLLAPGEDPGQVVEVITRRGQGEAPPPAPAQPVEAEEPGPSVLGKCLATGTKVCASCLVVSLMLGILLGVGLTHGNTSGGSGLFSGVGNLLGQIWSAE
jgi:hypothetical protein